MNRAFVTAIVWLVGGIAILLAVSEWEHYIARQANAAAELTGRPYVAPPAFDISAEVWIGFAVLLAAGFIIDEVIPLDEVTARPIANPRRLPSLRAGGWFVFAHRPGEGA